MESKFPGLRKGPKEVRAEQGIAVVREMLREVRP